MQIMRHCSRLIPAMTSISSSVSFLSPKLMLMLALSFTVNKRTSTKEIPAETGKDFPLADLTTLLSWEWAQASLIDDKHTARFSPLPPPTPSQALKAERPGRLTADYGHMTKAKRTIAQLSTFQIADTYSCQRRKWLFFYIASIVWAGSLEKTSLCERQ